LEYLHIINELDNNRHVFHALLKDIDKNMYLWKQAPDKWCLLEIICHLYDEEREDFRARVKHSLETPDLDMPSIDPQGWVISRNYIGQDYNNKLQQFVKERDESINWLHSLPEPNWESAYSHPKFGKMTAKMFLSNWLAHDYLHIRQITKLKFDYLKYLSGEDLGYAGNW
jgi:hypothetical protein